MRKIYEPAMMTVKEIEQQDVIITSTYDATGEDVDQED